MILHKTFSNLFNLIKHIVPTNMFWLIIGAILISSVIMFSPFDGWWVTFLSVGLILIIISIILFIFSHFDLPFILLICGTLVVMAGQNAFTSKHEIYTKYYVPTIIYKNSGNVILIGKTKTVISDSLLLYTSNNLYICKDEIYNEVNIRLNDMWYVCEK